MGKKPITVAAFEIGPTSLKFVEMTRDERRVHAVGILPLAPGRWRDPEHLAAQLRSALDTTARGHLRALIASVPLGEAWLRKIDVPHTADSRDYVAWDMGHYLGRPMSEIALDIAAGKAETRADQQGEHGDTSARPYIAAAYPLAETLSLRETLERATGLALTALDIDAAALINAFAANYPEFRDARTVLVQANFSAVSLVRVRYGTFQGAVVRRDAADSIRPEAEAQERAEGLLRAARAVAETVRTGQDGWDAPDQILLCGDLAVDSDFRELLKAHLPALNGADTPFGSSHSGFNLFNPFRNIPGPDPEAFPGAYPGAPLTATVGLALRLAEDFR